MDYFQRAFSSKVMLFTSSIILIFGISLTSGFSGDWGPDLAGPWCAKRPRGQDCCVGRDDICSVPILGTECYCDVFCNETAYDCCPDYWGHCHGIASIKQTTLPPPRTTRPPLFPCYKYGKKYLPGQSMQDNCNTCTCIYDQQIGSEFVCTNKACLIRPELMERINDGPYTWKATNYSNFWGKTLKEGVRYRLGTFLLAVNVRNMTPIHVEDDILPDSFDARNKWRNLLHPITDQGNCGSSWAVSTAAVASDRLAIETEGAIHPRLSPQSLLSCNTHGQKGCEGGRLDNAWQYIKRRGVVTEECYPYSSGETNIAGQCQVSKRMKVCPSGTPYKSRTRFKVTPPYRIKPMEREIMQEIKNNGPVQATIKVRGDFFMYYTGVYSYTALSEKLGESQQFTQYGYHSVRIIGWGVERISNRKIKFWLCANSWGSAWGEDGYFRILRGSDESNIESYVIGAWGKISGDRKLRALLRTIRRQRLSRRNQLQYRNLASRSPRTYRRQFRRNYYGAIKNNYKPYKKIKAHKKSKKNNKKTKKWEKYQKSLDGKYSKYKSYKFYQSSNQKLLDAIKLGFQH